MQCVIKHSFCLYNYYGNTCVTSCKTFHEEFCSLVRHGCNYCRQHQHLVQERLQRYVRSTGDHLFASFTWESQRNERWKMSPIYQQKTGNYRPKQRHAWRISSECENLSVCLEQRPNIRNIYSHKCCCCRLGMKFPVRHQTPPNPNNPEPGQLWPIWVSSACLE